MNKNVRIGIIASILIFGICLLLVVLSNRNNTNNIITQIDPRLTESEKKIYQDRLTDIENKLAQTQNDSDRFGLYMQRGFSYYGLGQFELAVKSFESARLIKPSDSASYVALYQVQLDMHDDNSALNNIKKAVDLEPGNADAWRKYVLIERERLGSPNDEITSLYSEAVVKSQNHIDVLTEYASWLEQVGNLHASLEYWKKALEVYPANGEKYQQEIDRIEALLNNE